MKEGDKIVCINAGEFTTFNGYHKSPVYGIKENEIYKFHSKGANYDILLYGSDTYYHSERFVTLKQYRKMKLNKIENKIVNGK